MVTPVSHRSPPRFVPPRIAVLACLMFVATGVGAAEAAPTLPVDPVPGTVLATLRPEHPRLLAHRTDFERIRRELAADTKRTAWWKKLQAEADGMLSAAPAKYEIPDGLRLLGVSRRVLHRAYHLGLAWQLTGDRKYPERLAREFDAVAAFQDWNPRHFLDTAEMAHALAIGYDWCFEAWTPEQRARIREALVTKALEPARQIHRDAPTRGGWPKARHNWNQVCNGGITLGALAIAEDARELAAELTAAAVRSIRVPMAEFAPDGAWAEGPAYWNYAVIYNVAMLAGLESALGTDFGLSAMPGFPETGFYPLHVTGPIGRTFNYADGRDGLLRAPHLFWLARKFQRPAFARYERDAATPHPLDLLWYEPALADRATPPEPLDRHFRGTDVVTLRSAWPTTAESQAAANRALFVGFKGGDNQANHSHLDLGSFVLDALGVRWGSDLGPENYNVPGYFGAQRWNYYLTRAEGHNTLVLGPDAEPDQDPKAAAPILRFASRPDEGLAVADLTAAYARHARRVHRGVALRAHRSQVLVQDEIDAEKPTDVYWHFHTFAQVEIRGREATLSAGKEKLWATILSPTNAQFALSPALPHPFSPQPTNQTRANGRKLTILLRQATDARLAVLFVPMGPDSHPPDPAGIPLKALADWN